eukprot:gnl/Dysnectes_brevis/597_a659_5326.p1 GENE.gnl/Dysnectes_brevis/597_a659_5326~~gnl/Dysnectes_brevis/597_a659_5326.p1  ORF type:complete len:244 (+),score=92.80 gnl/Dysnectes_brevis/597_a659_5326:34-765(+)
MSDSLEHAKKETAELISQIETHIGVSASEVEKAPEAVEPVEVVEPKPAPKRQQKKKQKKPKKQKVVKAANEFTAFERTRIEVCEIMACEPVEGSDKLLKMTLRTGSDEREFAAGIAAYFTPEELTGLKIVNILNLKARPMCGGSIISAAMLFAGSQMSEGEDGARAALKLVLPPAGAEVGDRVFLEGYEAIPEPPATCPKKQFDRVWKALVTKDGLATVSGVPFIVPGKGPCVCPLPDGCKIS